jgi:hypothetical protein
MWVMTQLVRQFKDLSPARRFWAPGVIAAAVALVAAAEVDIQRRPAGEVRGSKLLWRVLSLNALGSASYFRWGRRTTQQ